MTRYSSASDTYSRPDEGRIRASIAGLAIVLTLGAKPASAQRTTEELTALLDLSGSSIEAFWRDYSEVASTETVRQQKLTPEGEMVFGSVRSYDYLMVMQLTGSELTVQESRIEVGESDPEDARGPLLVTQGFSTLLLIFHPYFRNSFRYEWSEAPSGEPSLARVDFQALRGRRSPAALRLGGRDYPIQWRGTAWIDEASGMVTRIETELNESMIDLGLQSLTARTDYGRLRAGESGLEYWLPSSTTIEARSEQQYWRNEHRFDDYRVFSVDSELEIAESEGGGISTAESGSGAGHE